MSTKPKFESAAIVTLRRVPAMSAKGRRQIAAWLRRQAEMLVAEGKDYTESTFTARYLYKA